MLIHVKLSDRWPESQQPDSETDYKWAKRQQPLACCGATDDSRGGQEVESSVLNPPIPPSIHQPIPLLATIHSDWLIDKGKWEHSVVKIIQLCQVLCHNGTDSVFYYLSITATVTMLHVTGVRIQIRSSGICYSICTKQHIVKMLVNQRGHCLICGSSSCNYILAQYKWGISASGSGALRGSKSGSDLRIGRCEQ